MNGKLEFFLICCIFGISSVLTTPYNGCYLKMPTDLPIMEPVLLYAESSSASYGLFKPKGEENQLPQGSRLKLLCTGRGNEIESLNKKSVELYCDANGKLVTVDSNKHYNLKELGCTSIPASDLQKTDVSCASGKGYIFEAGFDIEDEGFAKVFSICYNNKTEQTLYSHSTLNGASIKYAVSQSVRRPFRADGMHFSTSAANKLYTKNNQIARFKTLFGSSQPFIEGTSFFARGHMAPDADFIFSYEQLSTYFYVNCAPEFQVINSGNWIRVENLARALAASYCDDLDIYTGVMGVLHLSHGSKKNVPVYLDKENLILAPEHYFKVIRHASTDSAIVMISSNNPFASKVEINELCENVCERAGVDNPIFKDISRGYTYCCELSAFKKIYTDLPADLTARNLLNVAGADNVLPPAEIPPPAAEKPLPSDNKPKSGCSITLPTDIPRNHPVYFMKAKSEDTPKLFRPTGQVTTIQVGSKLTLACIGYENNLELLSEPTIELTCGDDGTFFSIEKHETYKLSQLNCERIPTAEIEMTSNECGGSRKAYQFEAGFPWEGHFASVFSICYDNSTEQTLYSRSIINGAAINNKVTENSRRAFRANGMHFTTTAVNKYYAQKNQAELFETYFGASQPYITHTSYLARGHLSPDNDYVFSYEQLATYFYANVAPEFQVVNSGNWIRVENAARNLAASLGSDLLTFTGYLGILELPNQRNKKQKIHLDYEKKFPVPEWFYKILIHPNLSENVVMITLNNPFANGKNVKEFCPNVCAKYGLDSPFYKDVTRGYTFCCTLSDFKHAVPNLPTFEMPSGW